MFIYKRFFARFMDICIFYNFVFLIYVYFIVKYVNIKNIVLFFHNFSSYIHCELPYLLTIINELLLFILVLLLLSIPLAFLSAIFGTTPGKAAFGIRVLPQPDRKNFWARFVFYWLRELRVWVFGFGCGFLLISPFFMLWQALRLRAGKPAFYDRGKGCRIEYKKSRNFVLIICLPIALLMLTFIIGIFIVSLKLNNHLAVRYCNGGYERIVEELKNR